jgi:glycosyltransferase involved in cell wall biosynthesis
MKLHVYGNVLNNGYNLATILRKLGYDATFFLDQSSPNAQDYPWWEDTALVPDDLPEWIRYYQFNPNWFFPGNRERQLFADFGKADVALVCAWGPILAGKAGIPFVFYSYGEDLNMADTGFGVGKILRMMLNGQPPRGIRKYLTIGLLQRKYLKRAEYIAIGMTYQKTHLRALGLLSKMARIRLAWEASKYVIAPDTALQARYAAYDRVFFMIARHSWRSMARDLKGNDKFIRAFAQYVHDKKPSAKLVLIQKGHDVPSSRKLIGALGIEAYVEWVPEMNKDGIRAYLSLPNAVIVDQFWHDEWYKLYRADRQHPAVIRYLASDRRHPSPILKKHDLSLIGFGSASVEAMSAGRPLITAFFEHDFYDGEEPPIVSAFSETEIYEALLKVDNMSVTDVAELGVRAKAFVERFHAWRNVLPLYTTLLEAAVERRTRRRPSAASTAV